jgi:hypothetical protein
MTVAAGFGPRLIGNGLRWLRGAPSAAKGASTLATLAKYGRHIRGPLALAALLGAGVYALSSSEASAHPIDANADEKTDDAVNTAVEGSVAQSKDAAAQQRAANAQRVQARFDAAVEQADIEKMHVSERDLIRLETIGHDAWVELFKKAGGEDLERVSAKKRAVIQEMFNLLKRGLITRNQAAQRLINLAKAPVSAVRVPGGGEVQIDEETRTALYSEASEQIDGSDVYDAAHYRLLAADFAARSITARAVKESDDDEWLRKYMLVRAYYARVTKHDQDNGTYNDDNYNAELAEMAKADINAGWKPFDDTKVTRTRGGAMDRAKWQQMSEDERVAARVRALDAEASRLANNKDMLAVLQQKRYEQKLDDYAKEHANDAMTVNPEQGSGPGAYENIPYLEWRQAIDAASARYGVDKRLVAAVMQTESGWDPNARSDQDAAGLMQLVPDTAREMGYSPEEMRDPLKNIDAGVKYLRRVMDLLGTNDPALIAAGYNAGPGAVQEAGMKIPNIGETQAYVPRVLAAMGRGTYAPQTTQQQMPGGQQLGGQQQQQQLEGTLADRIAAANAMYGGVEIRGKLVDNMRVDMPMSIGERFANRTLTVTPDQSTANLAQEWAASKENALAALDAGSRAAAGQTADQVASIQPEGQLDAQNVANTVETKQEELDKQAENEKQVTIALAFDDEKKLNEFVETAAERLREIGDDVDTEQQVVG